MSNVHDSDMMKNKVYVNPNFKRSTGNNNPIHVNPRFPNILPSGQSNLNNASKIHINPNFMKKSVTTNNSVMVENKSASSNYQNTTTYYSHPLDTRENLKIVQATESVTKSRYCLVRQNTNTHKETGTYNTQTSFPLNNIEQVIIKERVPNQNKTTFQLNKYKSVPLNHIKRQNINTAIHESVPIQPNNTFRINKYKSVQIKDIKRNLDKSSPALKPQTSVLVPSSSNHLRLTRRKSSLSTTKRNQFKLVNNKTTIINTKLKARTSIAGQKKILQTKGHLKKNNIPCPMYRKFGKCLRKQHGTCDFLHDKKHVSICRKFIKGLCHDKGCLLSHDLTTKKMPTCYFYLQGTCTNEGCPYLHVKLNDNVKVCSDFLKGYCERGSKCLQRHINMQTRKKEKVLLSSQKKFCKPKASTPDISTSTKNTAENVPLMEDNANNLDRYYLEDKRDASATETFENIKPTRCKLGTLPSFIQL